MIYTNKDSNFYYGGKPAVDYFNKEITKRREQFPYNPETIDPEYIRIAKELKDKGFAHISQVLDRNLLARITNSANVVIDEGKKLKIDNEHFAFIEQPLLNVYGLDELIFSDLFVGIGEAFFECKPAVGTLSLRRSKLNDLSPRDTQLFHCDRNSIKFFKFFIYLNDVVEPEDGPFTIVEGTNKEKDVNWVRKHRWTDEEIKSFYGEDSIKYCTGKVGDLIVATTTSFHKGNKSTAKERLALVVNYVVHPELGGGQPKPVTFKMKKEFFETLPKHKKPVADFLLKELV